MPKKKLTAGMFRAALAMHAERLGCTQVEMADLLDTPPRTYWEYLHGKTTPLLPYMEGALARLKFAKVKRNAP